MGKVSRRRKARALRRRTLLPKKLTELVLYLGQRLGDDATYERVTWLMFRIDFEAYKKLGRSVTSAKWGKDENGDLVIHGFDSDELRV